MTAADLAESLLYAGRSFDEALKAAREFHWVSDEDADEIERDMPTSRPAR